MKGKYTNIHMRFMTSIEARFSLVVISRSRNPGWQDDPGESLEIPRLLAKCSKEIRDLESKRQHKYVKKRKLERKTVRNKSRAGAGRNGKREDDYYFVQ
jgi:hypothetical protein